MKNRKAVVCLLTVGLLFGLAISGFAQTSRRESANSYLERGNQWMKKGEVEKAIEDFSFALSFDSQLVQAYFNRGVARCTRSASFVNWKGQLERNLAMQQMVGLFSRRVPQPVGYKLSCPKISHKNLSVAWQFPPA